MNKIELNEKIEEYGREAHAAIIPFGPRHPPEQRPTE